MTRRQLTQLLRPASFGTGAGGAGAAAGASGFAGVSAIDSGRAGVREGVVTTEEAGVVVMLGDLFSQL